MSKTKKLLSRPRRKRIVIRPQKPKAKPSRTKSSCAKKQQVRRSAAKMPLALLVAAAAAAPELLRPAPPLLPRHAEPGGPVSMSEALRGSGLDEWAVATNLADVITKLKEKADATGTVERLLLDTLKECMRNLDSPEDASARSNRGGVPVIVQLVHQVRRPPRQMRAIEEIPVESSASDQTS